MDRKAIAKAILGGKPGGPHEGGIRMYHSSPHDFDKFDWSKLRSGEGANMYGAGFYGAENPAVSGQGGEYWKQFAQRFNQPTAEGMATRALLATKGDRAAAIEKLSKPSYQEFLRGFIPTGKLKDVEPQDAIRLLESGAPVGPRTYEVNFKAQPEQLLDWDKGLGRQSPHVQDALRRVIPNVDDIPLNSGDMLYRRLADAVPGMPQWKEHASNTLREAGVPGIRYLDEGSRIIPAKREQLENSLAIARHGADKGIEMMAKRVPQYEAELAALKPTHNYVAFDPSKLDIMAKYGVVGAPAGLALGGVADPSAYDGGAR